MKDYFYSEWVFVKSDDKDELDEAYEYLRLWKKFTIKKLHDLEYVDENIVLKEKINSGLPVTSYNDTLGIKLHMKIKIE